jgi:glycosyltransferase involved in cell wall biosynthesis
MKVIIVCSGTRGIISPFIKEQMDSLARLGGIEFRLFQIKKKGWLGYFFHLKPFLNTIKQFNPDLIHAHYGLSGFLANLQRKVPVLTTFHGSDINNPYILRWSKWAHRLSVASIFVEKGMMLRIRKHHNSVIIPCGVNLSTFYPVPKLKSQEILNLQPGNINILFSSGFDNPVKNYPLARMASNLAEKKIEQKINLLELKGLSRDNVNLYINASDCVLLYSSSEGSPQFIKEAMACNCPIVATDVGDISWVTEKTEGCYVASQKVEDVADKLIMAIEFTRLSGRTKGRERIFTLGLDADNIANRIMEVYSKIVN